MEKATNLNLQVDPVAKEEAEKIFSKIGMPLSAAIDLFFNQVRITGGLPFDVPMAPPSVNADLMTDEELRQKLQRGLDDIDAGRYYPAEEVFSEFLKSHGYGPL